MGVAALLLHLLLSQGVPLVTHPDDGLAAGVSLLHPLEGLGDLAEGVARLNHRQQLWTFNSQHG